MRMKLRHWLGMGVLSILMGTSTASAQFGAPAAPAAPGAASPASTPAAPAAGGAQPGFLAKCCAALDDCRRKCCATPFGQMLNAMTAPAAMFSGGIIPSFCPAMPSAADLAAPGVTGAADQAKKDALEAKARRAAVRYLGTLDCRYYPEAEVALIHALRADRIECVRLEAAFAFANGCCCTKKVMTALEICVSGSERDGNPGERSARVRDFAFIALERCVACFQEVSVDVEEQKQESKDGKERPPEKLKELPMPKPNLTKEEREFIERARKTVSLYKSRREGQETAAPQSAMLQSGQQSIFQIIRFGVDGASQAQPPLALQKQQSPSAPQTQLPAAPQPQPPTVSQWQQPSPYQSQPSLSLQTQPPSALQTQPPSAPRQLIVPPAADAYAPQLTGAGKPDSLLIIPPANQVATSSIGSSSPTAMQPDAVAESVNKAVDELLKGDTPEKRLNAILAIGSHDWKKSPKIVAALVKAARLDANRGVRIGAIRQLAWMQVELPYVINHLKYLETDIDGRIASEAAIAMQSLQAAK